MYYLLITIEEMFVWIIGLIIGLFLFAFLMRWIFEIGSIKSKMDETNYYLKILAEKKNQ